MVAATIDGQKVPNNRAAKSVYVMRMRDSDASAVADGATSRSVNRKTVTLARKTLAWKSPVC